MLCSYGAILEKIQTEGDLWAGQGGHVVLMSIEKGICRNSRRSIKKEPEFPGVLRKTSH